MNNWDTAVRRVQKLGESYVGGASLENEGDVSNVHQGMSYVSYAEGHKNLQRKIIEFRQLVSQLDRATRYETIAKPEQIERHVVVIKAEALGREIHRDFQRPAKEPRTGRLYDYQENMGALKKCLRRDFQVEWQRYEKLIRIPPPDDVRRPMEEEDEELERTRTHVIEKACLESKVNDLDKPLLLAEDHTIRIDSDTDTASMNHSESSSRRSVLARSGRWIKMIGGGLSLLVLGTTIGFLIEHFAV